MLKLFYITNQPAIAKMAEDCGVDRIFVDMEYIGKDKRQSNMDTVKNHHTIEDVRAVRKVLTKAELLVRINPIHPESEKEINDTIAAGADVIMLPMWKSKEDVAAFLSFVRGRCKTMLLLETEEARQCLDEVLTLDGIDEIHIGLNDLHLSQNKMFLFELLVDGTVDELIEKMKAKGIPYGFGGVGSVGGDAPLPAENILAEHYRLGSSMVILSRAFCDISAYRSEEELRAAFRDRMSANRSYEAELSAKSPDFFLSTHQQTKKIIHEIIKNY